MTYDAASSAQLTSTNASVAGTAATSAAGISAVGQCGAAPYATAAAAYASANTPALNTIHPRRPARKCGMYSALATPTSSGPSSDPSRSKTTIAAMQIIRLALTATPLGSTTRRCSLKIMSAPNRTSGSAAGAGRSRPQTTATATATPSTAAVSQRNCEGKVDTPVLLGWERVLWRHAAGSGPGGFLIAQ